MLSQPERLSLQLLVRMSTFCTVRLFLNMCCLFTVPPIPVAAAGQGSQVSTQGTGGQVRPGRLCAAARRPAAQAAGGVPAALGTAGQPGSVQASPLVCSCPGGL